ncbi:MAG: LPS-assembly protein LptD [Bacteroidetes bacterium]|uniref:LPS-assembly protein LptD n=1 Tax=Candidatus Cryptobacteroides excrementavium TaxID=2840759 RepID=A0A9D9J3J0_9BACT|nr:LPS-assembly protein LptD [Candidatus Cryptobacteroides excrementavium]
MSQYNRKTRHKTARDRFVVAAFLLLLISSFTVSSQEDRRNRRNRQRVRVERTERAADTVAITDSMRAAMDSTARADSVARADSIALLDKSSLDMPAFTTARDSIVEDFTEGKRMIYYYGDVTVTYGDMKLSADYMEYDLQTKTVFARGTKDSTGTVTGQPTMEEKGKTYTMEELRYNFDTRKARITNMITQEADGILHGKNIKMMPDQSINITNGKYTVCDCEEPHYYLHLTAAKVMTKPSQRTVFGPAYPVVEGVPMFPVVLPFGFIPKRPDRATGLLMPTFGEENSRGFYLRDLGMYFVIGDYFDLSVTGDIYTLGSWALDINSRYKVNYKCTGSFALTYSNDQTGEKGSSDFFQTKNFAVRWSHSQDSKARPGTSFSASVNFSSPSNNKYNSTNVTEALQNQISSSISYSKNWNGKMNLSVNALHSQNSRDSSYSFTLPNLTFSVSRFYPFKQKNRVGKKKFYEDFSLGYSTTLQNKVNFKASEFNKPGFLDKFQNGMTHNFQIGLPSFTLFKYINFTPSITYGMNWFFRKTERKYNPVTDDVEEIDSGQFGTFGTTHNYSGSISANTRLYGLFNFGKHRKIQAIRHIISPSVSFSFSPEKGTYFNGWRTLNYVDANGVAHSEDYNIYSGQIYSAPGKGKTASMSLSIGNNLEAKVRDLRDTTGSGTKKIKLIDQLNLSTGYNFLADSLNMNNIGITMSTSVFGKVGISANANFSPYAVVPTGESTYATINKFNGSVYGWDKPLRLTNASVSVSYSFSGEGKINGNDGSNANGGGGGGSTPAANYTRIYYHPVTGEYIPGGWLYYMNPNSPWSVNLNYSFNYSRSYTTIAHRLNTNHRYTQTLGVSGNVKITPALAINLTTGFDLMAMKMTTTQLSATYDLHCFNIAVSWVPNGQWESWSFRISANAAALADLLRFKKSSSYWDN